jgi:hypothetical protein
VPSTPENVSEDSDEDLRDMLTATHAGTRRTGVVRPAHSDKSMPALLAALGMCGSEPRA